MAEEQKTTGEAPLKVLITGAEKMFDNAERLFLEADILSKAGGIARPLFLHQISLEECSKINTLGAWAMSLLLGLDVNEKKILATFGRHEAKNKHNAYMIERGEVEKEAVARGDWKAAIEAFRRTQDEFHQVSNQAKNGALYVDWVGDGFASPGERITGAMLNEIRDRNATFLGYASNEIKMFRRLQQTPDVMRELLAGFVDQLENIREEKPDKFVGLMDAILTRFLEDGKRTFVPQNEIHIQS